MYENKDLMIQHLAEAYELIKDQDNWTVGAFARDKDHYDVNEFSDCAVKFCSIGALSLKFGRGESKLPKDRLCMNECISLLDRTSLKLYGISAIHKANDKLAHAEVLLIFEDAINSLKDSV